MALRLVSPPAAKLVVLLPLTADTMAATELPAGIRGGGLRRGERGVAGDAGRE